MTSYEFTQKLQDKVRAKQREYVEAREMLLEIYEVVSSLDKRKTSYNKEIRVYYKRTHIEIHIGKPPRLLELFGRLPEELFIVDRNYWIYSEISNVSLSFKTVNQALDILLELILIHLT